MEKVLKVTYMVSSNSIVEVLSRAFHYENAGHAYAFDLNGELRIFKQDRILETEWIKLGEIECTPSASH